MSGIAAFIRCLVLADWTFNPYIGGAKLRRASEAIIPGALSILQGTVPGRVRGSGHMVPTYFRRCSGIERFNGHCGFALLFLLVPVFLSFESSRKLRLRNPYTLQYWIAHVSGR